MEKKPGGSDLIFLPDIFLLKVVSEADCRKLNLWSCEGVIE